MACLSGVNCLVSNNTVDAWSPRKLQQPTSSATHCWLVISHEGHCESLAIMIVAYTTRQAVHKTSQQSYMQHMWAGCMLYTQARPTCCAVITPHEVCSTGNPQQPTQQPSSSHKTGTQTLAGSHSSLSAAIRCAGAQKSLLSSSLFACHAQHMETHRYHAPFPLPTLQQSGLDQTYIYHCLTCPAKHHRTAGKHCKVPSTCFPTRLVDECHMVGIYCTTAAKTMPCES